MQENINEINNDTPKSYEEIIEEQRQREKTLAAYLFKRMVIFAAVCFAVSLVLKYTPLHLYSVGNILMYLAVVVLFAGILIGLSLYSELRKRKN